MLEFVLFYKNSFLHASLSIILALTLTFFRIPILFLYALQTYIHPDSQPQPNGLKAAIRRPGVDGYQPLSSKTSTELRKRSKAKFLDCSEDNGLLENGVFVPILLSILSLYTWGMLFVKVTFERSALRRSEKQLSVVFGVLGVFLGLIFVPEVASLVLDFDFGVFVDGVWRVLLSVFIGSLASFLFIPAVRSARCFWLGTDQLRCNLPMITCGFYTRAIQRVTIQRVTNCTVSHATSLYSWNLSPLGALDRESVFVEGREEIIF